MHNRLSLDHDAIAQVGKTCLMRTVNTGYVLTNGVTYERARITKVTTTTVHVKAGSITYIFNRSNGKERGTSGSYFTARSLWDDLGDETYIRRVIAYSDAHTIYAGALNAYRNALLTLEEKLRSTSSHVIPKPGESSEWLKASKEAEKAMRKSTKARISLNVAKGAANEAFEQETREG